MKKHTPTDDPRWEDLFTGGSLRRVTRWGEPVLHARTEPVTDFDTDLHDLIRDMWAPMSGMYHFIPGGVDMATVHRQNFGFRPDSAIERVREGLESLVAADAWTRIEKALEEGASTFRTERPSKWTAMRESADGKRGHEGREGV